MPRPPLYRRGKSPTFKQITLKKKKKQIKCIHLTRFLVRNLEHKFMSTFHVLEQNLAMWSCGAEEQL